MNREEKEKFLPKSNDFSEINNASIFSNVYSMAFVVFFSPERRRESDGIRILSYDRRSVRNMESFVPEIPCAIEIWGLI